MLIEFSLSNFRSFRERQTLSMVAAPRLHKKANTFLPAVKGEKLPPLLKVAAVYGPNASGKTALLKAFDAVSSIAQNKLIDGLLPVSPFRFDPELVKAPSNFEIHFVADGMRYEFVLSASAERIVFERLVAYPKGKETLLYERKHTESGDAYEFGAALEGGSVLHEAWRRLTGPRVLFLSQAVNNSSEELTQLKIPFEWLRTGLMNVGGNFSGWAKNLHQLATITPELNENVLGKAVSEFLHEIDVPVTKIRFDDRRPNKTEGEQLIADGEDQESDKEKNRKKTTLIHTTALGDAEFDFTEESAGTQALIGFWLPWNLLGLGKDKSFCTLLADELDSSLHPLIVASLIAQHINKGQRSQLIFTTHDTHLMDTKLLRRDQIWITERDRNGATSLRSIHDFEGREGEDVEKRYYEGKYRGLPFLRTQKA